MASLYKSFRKNRKMWFALLTLMCMLSFVFIPAVIDLMGARGTQNPVLVTSRYGRLKETDVRSLVHQRQVAVQFLRNLHEAVVRAGGNGTEIATTLANIGLLSEKDVVESWLLVKKAQELGMSVNDQTVNAFINRAREGKVSPKQLQEILTQRRLSQADLFSALSQELLAARFREMGRTPLIGLQPDLVRMTQLDLLRMTFDMTPGERWDYFLRLNRAARIEAVPVDVAEFLAKVPEPTNQQIKNLFEQYRDREPSPNSAEPGFREPHRVAVEYVKFDYEKALDPSAITDAEIQKYYDANKETHFKDDGLDWPGDAAVPGKPEAKPEAKPAAKPESSSPAKPATKSEGKPEAAPKTDGSKPAELPKSTDPKVPAKSSSHRAPSPFRLVSYQGKDAPPPAAAKPAEAPASPAPAKVEPANSSAKGETASAKPAQPKYKPLEKVKASIRDQLAREKALGEIHTALRGLEDKMRAYHEAWLNYDALPEKEKSQRDPPEKLDLDKLVGQLPLRGVSVQRTGSDSAQEMAPKEIGQSYLAGPDMRATRRFTDVAFGSVPLFQPLMSQDDFGNRYLSWKVAEDKAKTPSLDEASVRDQVVRAWKLREARVQAKLEAEKLAERARKEGQALRKVFAGQSAVKVLEPAPFTWMRATGARTPGSFSAPELGSVQNIDYAGLDFMRAVFGLQPGEIAVAPNQPESVFYVVRVAEFSPSQEALTGRFFDEGLFSPYLMAKIPEVASANEAWLNQIKTEAELHWKREPSQSRGYDD